MSSERPSGLAEALVVVVDGQERALPAHLVRQVLSPRAVTRVPGADLPLVGLISWRGRVLGVLFAGEPSAGCPTSGLCVVVEGSEGFAALLVDEVKGFVQGEQSRIPPPLDLGRVLGEQ